MVLALCSGVPLSYSPKTLYLCHAFISLLKTLFVGSTNAYKECMKNQYTYYKYPVFPEYIVPPPSQSKPAVPPDKCPPTSLSFSSSGSRPRDITPSPSKHSAQITSPDSYKMAPQSQSAAVTPTAPVKVLTRCGTTYILIKLY